MHGLLGEAPTLSGASSGASARRGARPTALGEKLLGRRFDTKSPRFAVRLAASGNRSGACESASQRVPRLVLHASHDLALAELPELCASRLDLEVVFAGRHGLARSPPANATSRLSRRRACRSRRSRRGTRPSGSIPETFAHSLIAREQGLIASPDSQYQRFTTSRAPACASSIARAAGGAPHAGREDSVAAAVAKGAPTRVSGCARRNALSLDFVPWRGALLSGVPRSAARGARSGFVEVLRGREFAQRVAAAPGIRRRKGRLRAELDAALTGSTAHAEAGCRTNDLSDSNGLGAAFAQAWDLVCRLDPGIVDIVALSLRVSLTAVLIAAAIAYPRRGNRGRTVHGREALIVFLMR